MNVNFFCVKMLNVLYVLVSGFSKQDYCILFFPNELRYSMVEMKTLGSENPQVGSVVSVKDGTRKYKSTLVFISKLDSF